MPRSGHHGDAAEAAHVWCQVRGAVRQAGLRVSARGGCLSLPSWRAAAISLYERRSRQDAAALLDNRVPGLPQYCEATPTECLPCLGKPVSSMIHASIGPWRSIAGSTISRTLASTFASDHSD